MKKKFHAIPIIIYAPVSVYPDVKDAYNVIADLDAQKSDIMMFFAEDYEDGLVEIDPNETEFSGMINEACDHTEFYKSHLRAMEILKN